MNKRRNNANNLEAIDHVLLGVSDLATGIEFIKEITGLTPQPGGIHPHLGTHNALISLGEKKYLEVIAPLPGEKLIRQFEIIRTFSKPNLFTWSAHTDDIDGLCERVNQSGIEHSDIADGSRVTDAGTALRWRTLSLNSVGGQLVPFFIEWSPDTIHPSVSSPKGCLLKSFKIFDPYPKQVEQILKSVGLSSKVEHGPHASMEITIESPKGVVVM